MTNPGKHAVHEPRLWGPQAPPTRPARARQRIRAGGTKVLRAKALEGLSQKDAHGNRMYTHCDPRPSITPQSISVYMARATQTIHISAGPCNPLQGHPAAEIGNCSAVLHPADHADHFLLFPSAVIFWSAVACQKLLVSCIAGQQI